MSEVTVLSHVAPAGSFDVSTLSSQQVAESIAELWTRHGVRKAFALHVGGLAYQEDEQVLAAYRGADLVYADGVAVTSAVRIATGIGLQRSATTDIGLPVLQLIGKAKGGPIRIGLIGGTPGLAERASNRLATLVPLEAVYATHGYHEDWADSLRELREFSPDVVLVGMGCPREMLWLSQNATTIPDALYLTVGGWFGFLAGDEKRAPRLMRKFGMEWLFRLSQNPRDKFSRYAMGIMHTVKAVIVGRRRWRSRP